jgi:hypothetical protein
MSPLLYFMFQSCSTIIMEFMFMHVFYVKLIWFTPVTTIRTTIKILEPLILITWYYYITLTYPVEMFTAGTEMYTVKIFMEFFYFTVLS